MWVGFLSKALHSNTGGVGWAVNVCEGVGWGRMGHQCVCRGRMGHQCVWRGKYVDQESHPWRMYLGAQVAEDFTCSSQQYLLQPYTPQN